MIIRTPAIVMRYIIAIVIKRDFRKRGAMSATRMTETSWNAEAGIPIKIVWPASYPKPLMIKVENLWNVSSIAHEEMEYAYTCRSSIWKRDNANEKHEPP
jgi:hypothetical protein